MIKFFQTIKQHPDYFKQLTCKNMLFTQYDCPQEERKEIFFVECSYIAYVISGKRIFHKLEKSWDLSEGKAVFVKRGTHIAEKLDGEGWCVMVFFIPDTYLVEFFQHNRPALAFDSATANIADHVLPLEINDLSQSFFYSMIPYFSQTPAPHEDLLELKFRELLFSILSNSQNQPLLSHLNSISNGGSYSLQAIMENNFMSNLSLEEYAKLACKSLPTFKRHFQAVYKDTPASWIKKRRIQYAASMLQRSDLSIKDLAYECGFENHTHFNRVFKEITGHSPLEFKKLHYPVLSKTEPQG